MCIQHDSGGKLSILGGDCIGHCERIKFISTCIKFAIATEIEMFESSDLTPLDFFCGAGWRAKF